MIVAVDIGEAASLVRDYTVRHRLSFPHLLDLDGKVSAMFSVPGTPTNFLINRQGLVRGGGSGYRDWASPEAHRLIESLLQGGVDRKTKQR